MRAVGDRCYAAILLPMTEGFKIDEAAYRRFIQYFVRNPRFAQIGGLCINPEAGEIFYLTREEKRRVLEFQGLGTALRRAHRSTPARDSPHPQLVFWRR